ncbi:MAG TPA: hypothetical protein VIH97_10680 [Candidatus Acidoferrales bacterium]|jgi:vacuolar-type H+-ATPase subunit D/Vma8
MPKVRLTLHPAAKAIAKIEAELKSVRKRVNKVEQKKIDLELKTLKKITVALKTHCRGFAQTFDVKN